MSESLESEFHLVFPVVILEMKLGMDAAAYAEEIRQVIGDGNYTTYHDADVNKKFLSLATTKELVAGLKQIASVYAKKINLDRGRNPNDWKVQIWANIMKKDDVHEFHTHAMSSVSGTYYVQTSGDTSAIIFEDPAFHRKMYEVPVDARKKQTGEPPYYNYNNWYRKPAADTLLMWPSWLSHRVERQRKDVERISVSFNLDSN